MADSTRVVADRVRQAAADGTPLALRGGGSKAFYGRPPRGEVLALDGHRGILVHEPRELVLTARAGTPLAEIETQLAQHGQMLAFEPPHLGPGATLGGTIACGLSGPRRPWAGAARDFVLGVRIIDGRGRVLRFGGEVMKNVAGFDVSRLMCGALGTLGVLLEVSLKILPAPEAELTLVQEHDAQAAIAECQRLAGRPLPLSGACHHQGRLWLRLSGPTAALEAARRRIGGERADGEFWGQLREQTLPFFSGQAPLWRLSLPPATPPLDLPGDQLIDWGGGLRWLRSNAPAQSIRDAVAAAGGHATLFRGGDRNDPFHPLPEGLARLHRRLKRAFDPAGILNPGRLYADL